MARSLTAGDAKQSLTDHVTARGIEVFLKYGPQLGWAELQQLLADRALVRYPCTIVFEAGRLLAGEFAHPEAKGGTPEEGYVMYVHPEFQSDLDQVPALVLYQLVSVNYGDFASVEDAESFGAAALGLTRDEYYARICELADRLGVPAEVAVDPSGGCGSGCGCG